MRLSIYSIQDTLFEGEVEKIIANTPLGQITVLPNHLPLVSAIQGPALETVDKEGNKSIINLVSGFMEVEPASKITVLVSNR